MGTRVTNIRSHNSYSRKKYIHDLRKINHHQKNRVPRTHMFIYYQTLWDIMRRKGFFIILFQDGPKCSIGSQRGNSSFDTTPFDNKMLTPTSHFGLVTKDQSQGQHTPCYSENLVDSGRYINVSLFTLSKTKKELESPIRNGKSQKGGKSFCVLLIDVRKINRLRLQTVTEGMTS